MLMEKMSENKYLGNILDLGFSRGNRVISFLLFRVALHLAGIN